MKRTLDEEANLLSTSSSAPALKIKIRKSVSDQAISVKSNESKHEHWSNSNNVDEMMEFGDDISSLSVDHLFPYDNSKLSLLPDEQSGNKPIWISESGIIFLEAFTPLSGPAADFLTAIAEPTSRPLHIHEYKLTPYSLYAAVSVGLETENIIRALQRLSKVAIPDGVLQFIRSCTISYGKVKLVLKEGKYFVESAFPDILQMLLKDEIIKGTRASSASTEPNGILSLKASVDEKLLNNAKTDLLRVYLEKEEEDDTMEDSVPSAPNAAAKTAMVHSFEISSSCVEIVKKRCIELDYPMLEEYDFRADKHNLPLEVDLKPIVNIRPYQENSLSKMFSNGRSRSGIIVLPCGAGKTLVGIAAACTLKKATLILCTSAVAVEQWRREVKRFTNLPDDTLVARFTSDCKERPPPGKSGIIVSTYTMVAYSGKRGWEATQIMEMLQKTEFGLLILDEVHVVPANVFRRVLTTVHAHTKLGLTATLVREDDKIEDLNFLIGPKLYEANWLDLSRLNFIANVMCAEVWTPMTAEFYREYLAENSRKKRLLYVMNPKKFQACQFLINYHERRGDKIIVFSDNVFALKAYALKLKKPYIYGPTGQAERMRILHQFQANPAVNTIFLSKVGDTSIDLPEATCLIQISSHYGSRRQEAQRLGRILRAKRRSQNGFNAYFYSLVSKDTEEMYYSAKRQQFLIDQGYSFKVISKLEGIDEMSDKVYPTLKEQLELLRAVMSASENDAGEEEVHITDDVEATTNIPSASSSPFSLTPTPIVRRFGSIKALTGAGDISYAETTTTSKATGKPRHHLFRSRYSSGSSNKK